MESGERRGGIRTFLLGGLFGASAAIAAIDRRRRVARRRTRARGLAAFESAPCYQELIERERSELDAAGGRDDD